ncbi:MAG TPA: hypothetical protein VG796_07350 [Verrucomicrobiales bacterium]|jgi:hypothetical protein|nr:hypothetical protein [Verrucomicrobiales bacterium]
MSDDDLLLQQFESCTYPFEQWHHRAHVRVAWIYLSRYDLETASQKLRDGIRTYNAANNVKDTPTSGYHETMTMAWLRIIHATMQIYGAKETADEFFDLHPQLSQKKILRLFYSPQLFMSPRAKHEFLEPDLTSLPKAPG